MNRIILIPAYEPDDRLIDLVHKIKKREFDVVVVDDGSGRDYDSVFLSLGKNVKVIRYDVNQGKGNALKVGYQYIRAHYLENYIVVTMDCDGQHTIHDAKKLCDYIDNHRNALVLGKRLRDGSVPLRSRVGNGITKFIYHITTGLDVYDTQTGLRAFSDCLMDLFLSIPGDRFEYEMNVLLECARRKIPMKEIEIETIYMENNKGTHFDTFKDSYLVYKEIIKFSFSSIICFLIDYFLFIILSFFTNQIILSNVIARVVSASVNYFFNRKFVFESQNDVGYSFFSYVVLAIFILSFNCFILYVFVDVLLFNRWISKLVVEIILFFVSWFFQKFFVFKDRNNN